MLAAVLWLGNISFQVTDNENHVEVLADEGRASSIRTNFWLSMVDLMLVLGNVEILS